MVECDGRELAPLAGGGLEVGRPRPPHREMFTLGPKHRLGYVPARHISPPRIHLVAVAVMAGSVRVFVGRPGFDGCWA